MKSPRFDRQDRNLIPWDAERESDPEQMETAHRIVLESIEEDHRALERDAKLTFSSAALM
ncbi:hypothetical protein ABZ892_07020 [Streptomyces sp. NPDC046924]|uniref:hypothetical protein n=1 Tax=Streptomyces sp. NPDC046924 TaxID=3155136 RepID=UPI0033F45F33